MPFLNVDPVLKFDRSFAELDIISESQQDKKSNQPYILNLTTLDRLYFQTIPQEVAVTAESQFISILAPGRNNPNYHFTGSEDVVNFTITWYCNHESRHDVIKKCKWLQSLSKNNGYKEPPPLVKFAMGLLFIESKFIVASAPYRLGNFNREFGMLPAFATQDIELRRVTDENMMRNTFLKLDV